MKVKLLFSAFLILSLSFACNKTDSDPEALNGTWHLYSVTGGFAGVNDLFEEGEVVWDINDNSVSIANADTTSPYGLMEDGVYTFDTKVNDKVPVIQVDKQEIGSYHVDKNDLFITQQYVDGFSFHFRK